MRGLRVLGRTSAYTTQAGASDAASHDGVLEFRQLWLQLRKEGWTSKGTLGGRCLDSRYHYVRPGGNPRGIEGDDYLGEDAVLHYVYTKATVDAKMTNNPVRSDGPRRTTTRSVATGGGEAGDGLEEDGAKVAFAAATVGSVGPEVGAGGRARGIAARVRGRGRAHAHARGQPGGRGRGDQAAAASDAEGGDDVGDGLKEVDDADVVFTAGTTAVAF